MTEVLRDGVNNIVPLLSSTLEGWCERSGSWIQSCADEMFQRYAKVCMTACWFADVVPKLLDAALTMLGVMLDLCRHGASLTRFARELTEKSEPVPDEV